MAFLWNARREVYRKRYRSKLKGVPEFGMVEVNKLPETGARLMWIEDLICNRRDSVPISKGKYLPAIEGSVHIWLRISDEFL